MSRRTDSRAGGLACHRKRSFPARLRGAGEDGEGVGKGPAHVAVGRPRQADHSTRTDSTGQAPEPEVPTLRTGQSPAPAGCRPADLTGTSCACAELANQCAEPFQPFPARASELPASVARFRGRDYENGFIGALSL